MSWQKAEWIANQMEIDTDPDDVYDVLLGNITEPSRFVAQVEGLSDDYDTEIRRMNDKLRKIGLDAEGTRSGRFSSVQPRFSQHPRRER